MDLRATEGVASRFKAYIEHLRNAVGHADRREPLAAYCAGLLLPGERKSVEPMAARLAPEEVSAKHQSLHHFVAKAPWEEAALLGAVRNFVLPRASPLFSSRCRSWDAAIRARARSTFLAAFHRQRLPALLDL